MYSKISPTMIITPAMIPIHTTRTAMPASKDRMDTAEIQTTAAIPIKTKMIPSISNITSTFR